MKQNFCQQNNSTNIYPLGHLQSLSNLPLELYASVILCFPLRSHPSVHNRSKSRTGNTLYFFPIRFNKLHFSFVPPRRKDYTGISLATRLLTVSLLSFPLYVSTVEFHERRLSQCPPPLSPHYYYWRYGWFPRLMPNSLAWDAFLNLTSLPSCL